MNRLRKGQVVGVEKEMFWLAQNSCLKFCGSLTRADLIESSVLRIQCLNASHRATELDLLYANKFICNNPRNRF